VTAVIFVAAISEYDQVLFEDGETNRIDEAIRLFGEIYATSFFPETMAFILFLNKVSLAVACAFGTIGHAMDFLRIVTLPLAMCAPYRFVRVLPWLCRTSQKDLFEEKLYKVDIR